MEGGPLKGPGNAAPVLRKILVTVAVGGVSFPFTQLLFTNLPGQIAAAGAVGAVVLMVQFLIDFERRLAKVESGFVECVDEIGETVREGFAKVNQATSLVAQVESGGLRSGEMTRLLKRAAKISPGAPVLVRSFVQLEVEQMSELLGGLAGKRVTYEGEDQEWLLNLTRSAERTIDAMSLPEVDKAGNIYHSFWQSNLGRRYMDLQDQAIQRGVRVRRVFVTEEDEMAGDPVLQDICRLQAAIGIEVRLLDPATVDKKIRGQIFDFIMFDDELSYETTPEPGVRRNKFPGVRSNTLELHEDTVTDRIALYQSIWSAATPWTDVASKPDDRTARPEYER
jgi:hypothetical protein